MKPRYRTFSILNDSTNHNSLTRQMTITEAFRKAKKPAFKMPQFSVTNNVIEIDSDSDEEGPPLQGVGSKLHESANDGFIGSDTTLVYDYTGQTNDCSTIPNLDQNIPNSNKNTILIKEQLIFNYPENFVEASQDALDSFSLGSNVQKLLQTPHRNEKEHQQNSQTIFQANIANNMERSNTTISRNTKSLQSSDLPKLVSLSKTVENNQICSHSKAIIKLSDLDSQKFNSEFKIRDTSKKIPVKEAVSLPAHIERGILVTKNPTGRKRKHMAVSEGNIDHKKRLNMGSKSDETNKTSKQNNCTIESKRQESNKRATERASARNNEKTKKKKLSHSSPTSHGTGTVKHSHVPSSSKNSVVTPTSEKTTGKSQNASKDGTTVTKQSIDNSRVKSSSSINILVVKQIDANNKNTPPKTTGIDKQQPSTSKSSTAETSKETTPPSENISASPNKLASFEMFTAKRCYYGSPVKYTPSKYCEAKNSKAEKVKQAEDKHLNALIDLLQIVLNERHLRNLLSQNETNLLKRFMIIDKSHKYVLLKLYIWERGWYNLDKFCYVDGIQMTDERNMLEIFTGLNMDNFVDNDYTKSTSVQNIMDILRPLSISQLKSILEGFRKVKNEETSKQIITASIIIAIEEKIRTPLNMAMEPIKKQLGIAIRIKDEVYDILNNAYMLATFINPIFEESQTYFKNIIDDNVDFPRASVFDYSVFANRTEFMYYVLAKRMKKGLDAILRKNPIKYKEIYDIGTAAYESLQNLQYGLRDYHERYMKVPHLKKFSAQHVFCSILTHCSEKIYTRQAGYPLDVKEWLEFMIENYPQSRSLGTWYYRLIWLHMKQLQPIDFSKAAKLLIKAYSIGGDILTEADKYKLGFLSRSHKFDRLSRHSLIVLAPKPIHKVWTCVQIKSDLSGKKQSYFTENNGKVHFTPAEHSALQYYRKNGYLMSEKATLMKSLLLLYFWDIIYNSEESIPAAFISKLQSAPLDMFTPYFYKNRETVIKERLKAIASEWPEEELLIFGKDNYQNHSHEMTAFGVVMKFIKEVDIVGDLVTLIGRKVLAKIFERLISNIREFCVGMPDLLLWNTERKMYKFVKVNNQNHRPDANEILWLHYLYKWEASVEVCWVESNKRNRNVIRSTQESD